MNKTKSKTYSKKLNKLFSESVNLLSEHPKIGRTTNDEETRINIVRDYLIFYEFTDKEIIIQSVWDARRDKKILSLIIHKIKSVLP
ncbi:MAG: type II toxin-antitoxin system RelE/ParE family toxin [Chitinophagales bacterium]|nr:type II toxin-antitoxin system RelE/ParE family toxin [Chitinophagales bacterium]